MPVAAVGRPEAERGILQQIGREHHEQQAEAVERAGACRLHEMGRADGGAREEKPRPEADEDQ